MYTNKPNKYFRAGGDVEAKKGVFKSGVWDFYGYENTRDNIYDLDPLN